MSKQSTPTNTSNQHYDLVSMLYHALEGAQTYATYVEDAGREGDQELAQFFLQLQQQEITRADQAKQLLAQRLNQ
jgi:rubrerythrin